MSDWRALLTKTRAHNRSKLMGYDLRCVWRANAFRQFSGQPEPMIRAEAFASVLRNAPLHVYDDDEFVGSRTGFVVQELPDGISEDDYQSATSFCEKKGQRNFAAGFDHTLADYPRLLSLGIGGLINACDSSLKWRRNETEIIALNAMKRTLSAFSEFVLRYASVCEASSKKKIADRLRRIAERPPENLSDALQLVWLTHIAFVSEGRYAMALGRIDQYLFRFYQKEVGAGATREAILNQFLHIWAKIEELGEVTNICIGGLTHDGNDATNELSYICLDATRLVQSPHTNLSARFHDGSTDRFHRECFNCIRTGVGFPAIFNDHVLIDGLTQFGIPLDVARDYCLVGCIETMLSGRQQAWSDSRFNTPLTLLNSLKKFLRQSNGTYNDLKQIFKEELAEDIRIHVKTNNEILEHFPADRFPDPFLSALTSSCIDKGLDINDGGADFSRFHGIAIMGLATIADSLAAVKKLVIDAPAISPDELIHALDTDFKDKDFLRLTLMNRAPKYGNGDKYVDEIAAWVVDIACDECQRHTIPGGGRYMACIAANVQNISAGRQVPATPDGRRAFMPLSDAASPSFGRDMNGPTAFLHSVALPDYRKALGGSVINMKFEPSFFNDEFGAIRFGAITKMFVRERIQELQFNFTGNEVLIAAKNTPSDYRNLVVRVSGFSAYFTTLAGEVQDDVIRRRAHV